MKFVKNLLHVMQKLTARWVAIITTNDVICGTAAYMGRARVTFLPWYMINKSIIHLKLPLGNLQCQSHSIKGITYLVESQSRNQDTVVWENNIARDFTKF